MAADRLLTQASEAQPPKDSARTFVLISVGLTLGCWILVPIFVGIALAT